MKQTKNISMKPTKNSIIAMLFAFAFVGVGSALAASAPAPTITTFSPASKVVGEGAFTLTVNGTTFNAGITATFNGQSRTVTRLSTTKLQMSILASDLTSAGAFAVVVENTDHKTGSKNFSVNKATPTVTVTVGSYTYSGSAQGPNAYTTSPSGDTGTPTWSYQGTGSTAYGPSATRPTLAGTYKVTVSLASDANFNAASSSATDFTIGKASSTTVVTLSGSPFTYTGSAITPATVSVTGAGGLSLTPAPVYANNFDAGTATASYTYAGDANHAGSSDSKTFTIGQASSTTVVTITGSPFTYSGSAITPATVSVTGVGLSLTPAPVYANNIDAGIATASYTYAGDINHVGSSDSKSFAIGQASSTTVVTITGSPFTYSGSAITPATGSVTGAGLSLIPVPVYANNIDAGSATASYTYAGDANHAGSSDSKTFTIGQASSTTVVTITGSPFTYSGSAITPATVSVTGAGALSLTPAPDYANNVNAGSATASSAYAGDANHAGSSDSQSFTIAKATPIVTTWPTASVITYGDTLDKSTLSGGVPADGSFAFTTPAIVPDAGTAPQDVTYTPLDTANYDTVSGPVDVTVYEKLTGKITLYNYLGGEGAKVTVVFVAKDSGGNEVGRDEVELDASTGNPVSYAIGVPVSTATLSAKPRFFLRQRTSVTAGNTAGLDSDFVEFIGGDADNNNQVDGTDYAWLRACWGQSGPLAPNDINGDTIYDARDFPDFNGDGNINASDYEVLKHGWYKMGIDE